MSRVEELALRFPFLAPLLKLPKIAQMSIAAGVIAVAVVAALTFSEPSYKVLFSNLGDKDGGTVVSALQKMNVPYRMSENGAAILVPAKDVHTARMMLAEQGLPQSGNVGFELMNDTKFGASQFTEQITYQRAIEGELARSIEAMNSILSARVHLAIPKETLFVRDQKRPSASVLLNLHPGRTLSEGQIAAISWLVASSVPNLTVEEVSIVDQTGKLLSTKAASDGVSLSATQVKYTLDIEQRAISRIMSILTPITGMGNVHAQVTAEVDFNQREQTSEVYRPNQAPELAAVRSEQISEINQNGITPPEGVPGALSNEPPPSPEAPISTVGQGQQGQGGQVGTGGPEPSAAPSSSQRNVTRNYEVDRTISHVKEAVGQLKRMSVAVVVNYRPDEEGGLRALTEDEIAQIRSLVEQAVGYSQDRGDTISVTSAPLNYVSSELAVWKDPYYIEMAKALAQYLILGLLAILVWFKIVMPFVRKATESAQSIEDEAVDLDVKTEIDAQTLANESMKLSQRYEQAMQNVREIAKQDPRAAAFVLREWMRQELQR